MQDNFDTYRSLRIHEMPEVEVAIVRSTEKPTGVGEPGVPPIGPAVANAMARLGLGRPRRLPVVRGDGVSMKTRLAVTALVSSAIVLGAAFIVADQSAGQPRPPVTLATSLRPASTFDGITNQRARRSRCSRKPAR